MDVKVAGIDLSYAIAGFSNQKLLIRFNILIRQMKPAKTKTTLNSSQHTIKLAGGKETEVSKELLEQSRENIDTVLKELKTSLDGLSQ